MSQTSMRDNKIENLVSVSSVFQSSESCDNCPLVPIKKWRYCFLPCYNSAWQSFSQVLLVPLFDTSQPISQFVGSLNRLFYGENCSNTIYMMPPSIRLMVLMIIKYSKANGITTHVIFHIDIQQRCP